MYENPKPVGQGVVNFTSYIEKEEGNIKTCKYKLDDIVLNNSFDGDDYLVIQRVNALDEIKTSQKNVLD